MNIHQLLVMRLDRFKEAYEKFRESTTDLFDAYFDTLNHVDKNIVSHADTLKSFMESELKSIDAHMKIEYEKIVELDARIQYLATKIPYDVDECDVCGHYFKIDELNYGELKNLPANVCKDCFFEDFYQCSKCGEYYDRKEKGVVDGAKIYCESCSKRSSFPKMYTPPMEHLDALKAEATNNGKVPEEKWRKKLCTTLAKIIAGEPRRYRAYGPYWWVLKQAMLDNGIKTFGKNVDEEGFALVDYGNPTYNLLAAWEYGEHATDTGLIYSNRHNIDVLADETSTEYDTVEYMLEDQEIESGIQE